MKSERPRSRPKNGRVAEVEEARDYRVAVIGAGPSGIGAAIRLKQIGIEDFVVLEKADAVGGTWRDNTYPGCACDVPSTLYSYSFAPNPNWTRAFATQPEIKAYLSETAARYDVLRFVHFGAELLDAVWNEATARWELDTPRGRYTAQILVGASGPWHEPNMPDVAGLARFEGTAFHSARWNHDFDPTGKRIAVVGTGASAVQFVPEIEPKVRSLHVFQRTPSWVLPKPDHFVPPAERSLFTRVPATQEALRLAEYWLLEALAIGFRNPSVLEACQRIGLWHLRRSVRDPKLRALLTPTFTLGCKRILLSNTYYRALAKPHVEVHPTAVTEIRERSIVGADGTEIEVDAIVFGTGFQISEPPIAKRVRGTAKKSLAAIWDGSPEAYLGTTVSGFPNFFLLLGPNLGTGHSSAFSVLEAQLRYVIDAIQTIDRHRFASVDVRPDVQAAYNAEIQTALASTVYNAGGCASYYIDRNGKNSFSWPWSTTRMLERVRDFDVGSYVTRTASDRASTTAPRVQEVS